MARIMAIDYGKKRVGIAVTDPMQMIANGLTTVHAKDIIVFIKDYLSKEEVSCIVVGEPKTMMNKPSESAVLVEAFIKQLKKNFPTMTIARMDERFTSRMAFQTMIDTGLKKKARQNKELVDTISATIILQSYMETMANKTQQE
ncbi:MAG: Holliday junction resolvase RuvX [Bacteroidota bacterium]